MRTEKRRKTTAAVLWILTLMWIGVMFFFAGQSGEDSGALSLKMAQWICRYIFRGNISVEAFHPVLRKLAHFGIFAVLGVLMFYAAYAATLRIPTSAVLTASLCVTTAALNELYQYIPEGRGPGVRDVMIDSAGAGAGILAALLVVWLVRRKRGTKFTLKKSF